MQPNEQQAEMDTTNSTDSQWQDAGQPLPAQELEQTQKPSASIELLGRHRLAITWKMSKNIECKFWIVLLAMTKNRRRKKVRNELEPERLFSDQCR